jgi:esterase/lipase
MKTHAVEMNVDDQVIYGNIYTPDQDPKKVAFLFLHGWTGRPNQRAAAFLVENGFAAMTISMRGHAPSDGDIKTVTAQNSIDDAKTAYDYLKSELSNDIAISAIGNSYGGYIATLLSGERQIHGLFLRVPACYPDENFDQPKWGHGNEDPKVMSWRQQPHNYNENRALSLLHSYAGNVQILEAQHDTMVPHQTIINYVNAVPDKRQLDYTLMKGWPHSLGEDSERNQQLQELLIQWAYKQLQEN